MTRFWWIRHGPTHEKAFVGWRDVPADLSDTAAISRLSAFLPRTACVVSSDLVRASATADAIAGDRKRLPHNLALREFNFGEWDGKHFSDVSETHPELSRAYWETPGDITPPGGESWNMVADRVGEAVKTLLLPDADIVVVAHIGVIMTQVQQARAQTPAQAIGQKIDNLSLTRLDFDGTKWVEHFVNRLI